jgi:DNA repair protein SbcC/Rad50
MMIKKLKLENIRSYKSQQIDFPPGKTLFEGDIGSGKSTLLMAIEFGLFGLGSEKAGSLLKAGETEGSVGLVFESDGREYVVTRHLVRKKNSISQQDCILKTPEETRYYSATEIKEKILEILNFNEPPDPKAQSVIYRYAVYTPQEEMKAILTNNPEQRLQTLRKAFGIEDYKIAGENAKGLSTEIRIRSIKFATIAEEIQSLRSKVDLLKASISQKKAELENLAQDRKKMEELIQGQKTKLEQLRSKQLALKEEAGRADPLFALITEKDGEIKVAQDQLSSNKSRINIVQPKIVQMGSLVNPSELAMSELKVAVEKLEDELATLQELETKIRVKFSDYKSILEKGVCPTCDTLIERGRFSDLVAHKDQELKGSETKVAACKGALQKTKTILERKIEFDQAQERLKDHMRSLSEYEENVRIWQRKLDEAKAAREKASGELENVRASVQSLQEVNSDLKSLEARIQKSEEELKLLENTASSGEASIFEWEKQKKEHEESIEKRLGDKARSDKLNEYQIWVQDYFLPTLDLVEKHVMVSINQEFDAHFQRWFGMLVEDPGKQAKVDEEFTPVVQQDGIDQDVAYLSGGEKTSIALAYRLALNAVVRRVSTGMKSNLLILDEPTDGFSKEQLSKVREILDELQSPQIILVSHERELESFADQVIRVSKTNGVSSIAVVQ